jgi:hypothetical protein
MYVTSALFLFFASNCSFKFGTSVNEGIAGSWSSVAVDCSRLEPYFSRAIPPSSGPKFERVHKQPLYTESREALTQHVLDLCGAKV